MAKNRSHSSDGPSQRQLRVGELIRRTLADVLARGDIHDPDLNRYSITVGEVRTSPDLKVATAFVVPLMGDGQDELLGLLNRNRNELRRIVAKNLTLKFSRMVGPRGRVVLADINASMLRVGRDKLIDNGVGGNVEYVQANAECLPFPDNSFDCITIAFGLRNVTDQDAALRSMQRVLKPGGRLLILEFSKPENPLLSKAYDEYSFRLLPRMGQMVAGDAESYRYLAESIRMHPDQDTLKAMMEAAGLDRVEYTNLTGGIVALHRGIKL